MPKFFYKAVDSQGVPAEGEIEGVDKQEVAKSLKSKGLQVLLLHVLTTDGFKAWFARANEAVISVSLKDKIFFASNLSEMINAGLALSRALSVLKKQTNNKKLKSVIDAIMQDVDSGTSFASALGKHPKIFPQVFVAMVEAGEKSGQLPGSLKIVAEQLQKGYALRKKVRSALTYPSIIIIAMIGIAIVMMIYIVPTLAATFRDIGAELPLTTRIVIGTSDLITHNAILLAILVPVAIVALWRGLKTRTGRRMLAWMLLRMPLFKGITKQVNSATTSRTLSALVSSGVDIIEALRITEKVVQNDYYKEVLRDAAIGVEKGSALSTIFQLPHIERLYPPFVGEMMAVGEETGKFTDMLLKLAVFYENEVDAVTKDLSTVIEPIIMIVVGFGVGFFALSMIQPIYSIGSNI